MENTGKVLFEGDQPQWYIAMGDRHVGPMLAADVYQKVLDGQIAWDHLVWKPGLPEWKRICDLPAFQATVPSLPGMSPPPGRSPQQEVKAVAKPVIKAAEPRRAAMAPPPAPTQEAEEKIWFLFFKDSQSGPYSTEEVSRFLQIGRINSRVHAWRDGMEGWVRLEKIKHFAETLSEVAKTPAKSAAPEKQMEHRGSPRKPLVARILMADDESVSAAICRDISVGGMQVLIDKIPGKVGTKLKLNVSPSSEGARDRASRKGSFEPFVAEGVIVRILEDQRGFSFRFERLTPSAKRAIEAYLNADER